MDGQTRDCRIGLQRRGCIDPIFNHGPRWYLHGGDVSVGHDDRKSQQQQQQQ